MGITSKPIISSPVISEVPPRVIPRQSPLRTSTRDSNAVRASVFDLFLELGGLEKDSKLAHWMFSDPSVDDEAARRRPVTFREDSGSRFKERLDVEHTFQDNTPRSPNATPSRSSRFFSRVRPRSKSRSRTKENGEKVKSEIPSAKTSPSQKNKGKRMSFFQLKSKSATDLRTSTLINQAALTPPIPRDSSEKVASTSTLSSSRHSQSTIRAPPSPSTPTTINEAEWDKVSLSSAIPQTPIEYNPFVGRPPLGPDGQPIVSSLSQRVDSVLSFPSRTSKRISFLPIRSLGSRPESQDTQDIPRKRAFSFSGTSVSQSARLSTTMSHT